MSSSDPFEASPGGLGGGFVVVVVFVDDDDGEVFTAVDLAMRPNVAAAAVNTDEGVSVASPLGVVVAAAVAAVQKAASALFWSVAGVDGLLEMDELWCRGFEMRPDRV